VDDVSAVAGGGQLIEQFVETGGDRRMYLAVVDPLGQFLAELLRLLALRTTALLQHLLEVVEELLTRLPDQLRVAPQLSEEHLDVIGGRKPGDQL
jgi:hypothetical protein